MTFFLMVFVRARLQPSIMHADLHLSSFALNSKLPLKSQAQQKSFNSSPPKHLTLHRNSIFNEFLTNRHFSVLQVEGRRTVFKSPLSQTNKVESVKVLSLSRCVLSLTASPVICCGSVGIPGGNKRIRPAAELKQRLW